MVDATLLTAVTSMPCAPTLPAVPVQVAADDYLALTSIYDPAVNLCVVNRSPATALIAFCRAFLPQAEVKEVRHRLAIDALGATRLFPEAAHLPGYAEWYSDVQAVVTVFADLFAMDQVGLRLAVLTNAMCPRFHVDALAVRMICTYCGPGTEWLPEESVTRPESSGGGLALPHQDVGQDTIQRIPPYAIALLKGERWEGNQGRGLVHRSPALSTDQPRRLVLTLDII